MAKRKVVPIDSVQIESIDFGGMFPFTLKVIYKKGTTIEKIIYEAAGIETNLVGLANAIAEEDDRTPLSMVYKLRGETNAYMFIADDITIDTIVHESVHVVCRLFEIIGSNINEETEEFFAYIQTDVFKRVYKMTIEKFNLNPPVLLEEEE